MSDGPPTLYPAAWFAVLALAAAMACGRGADSSGAPTRAAPPKRFATVGDGVVRDSQTGLEWTSRDHDQSLAWDDADRYCRELTRGERAGWRLPGLGELQALYDKHVDQQCGNQRCHLEPAISLADPYVWSASTRSPRMPVYLDFSSRTDLCPGPSIKRRVICVRQASS